MKKKSLLSIKNMKCEQTPYHNLEINKLESPFDGK